MCSLLCRLKIADCLAVCGDAGAYLFQFLEIDEKIRNLFVDSFHILKKLRAKVPPARGEFKLLHGQLMVLMTELEMALPLHYTCFTKHGIGHLVEQMERAGCFWAYNMLPFERWHVMLKSFARGTRNIMASIQTHYEVATPPLIRFVQ